MRVRSTALTSAVLVGLAGVGLAGVGLAGVGAAIPARAEAVVPLGRPTLADLGFDAPVGGLLPVGDAVWVSHDDQVDIFTASGTLVDTVPDLPGVRDLAPSPSGDRVFAALAAGSGVAVLSVGDHSRLDTWDTPACPQHLSSTAHRVFYSYGCAGTATAGIASLDLASGADAPSGVSQVYSSPPLLRSADGVLVAADDADPAAVHSYTVGSGAALTLHASTTVAGLVDLDLSPDGLELVAATGSGGHLLRLSTDSLSRLGSVTADSSASATATAFDPDAASFAAGLTGSTHDQLIVFDADGGAPISHSADHVGTSANPGVLPGTLHYSPDSSLLFALTHVTGRHVGLAVAGTAPAAVGTVTLTLTRPQRFGDPLYLRVRTPGRPNTAVRLTLTDATGADSLDTTTNGSATIVLPAEVEIAGVIVVRVAADRTHSAAVSTARYSVPAALRIGFSGYRARTGGVLHFRTVGAVRAVLVALPSRSMRVTLRLQEHTSRGWRASAPAKTVATDGNGLLAVSMGGGRRAVLYRLVISFNGDSRNGRSPTITSPVWQID